jgi:hypothetical protein
VLFSGSKNAKHFCDENGYVVIRKFLNEHEIMELIIETERFIKDIVPGLPRESVFYDDKST